MRSTKQDIQDFYRQFQRVIRVHEHLAAVRHAGQAHGINKFVPHRKPGELITRCPRCPEPGFNVDIDTIKQARHDERLVVF